MSNVNTFVSFAKSELKEILDYSGNVLYSSSETLKPGTVYLLGYNPGGAPEDHKEETIERSLDGLPKKKRNNYIDDEGWKSDLQDQVLWLLKKLGLNPAEVCASNLIFKRSKDDTGVNYPEDADTCWPVHERILQVVKPKMIIAFGNGEDESTYKYLKDNLENDNEEVTCDAGHKNWKCKSFKSASGVAVIGLPHLSIYSITHNPDVIDWIKQLPHYPL